MTTQKADEPQRITAVVLFAETRGFTGNSDILSPEVVLARLTEFVSFVSGAVAEHRGTVVDILSDTLMATFFTRDDAKQAVEAARKIQGGFAAIAEAWERDFGIRAAVSMGLHCGEAVVGIARTSVNPRQFFVFGDCVSVANRLMHRARAGESVMSEELLERASSMGMTIDAESLPPLAIPRRTPIKLYGMLIDPRLDFTSV